MKMTTLPLVQLTASNPVISSYTIRDAKKSAISIDNTGLRIAL
jgi:hypothetical protein